MPTENNKYWTVCVSGFICDECDQTKDANNKNTIFYWGTGVNASVMVFPESYLH